jgi:hypothetical protein
MRWSFFAWALFAALCAAPITSAPAKDSDLAFPAEHHPWGHFSAGSWKRIRTTSESLDDKGHVVSVTITDSKTTLVAVDEVSYTLRTDASVDVASRLIAAPSQTIRHGFYGELGGQAFAVKRGADASVTIDGKAIPCEVRQVVLSSEGGKLVSNLFYSEDQAPYVLRRETSVEGAAEEKRNSTLVEVVSLNLPQRIRGELKPASHVKTTQKLLQSSKITMEVHCEAVPGGVVAHWASELDLSGRVLRRSTLELIDYAVGVPTSTQPSGTLRRPIRGKAARRVESR